MDQWMLSIKCYHMVGWPKEWHVPSRLTSLPQKGKKIHLTQTVACLGPNITRRSTVGGRDIHLAKVWVGCWNNNLTKVWVGVEVCTSVSIWFSQICLIRQGGDGASETFVCCNCELYFLPVLHISSIWLDIWVISLFYHLLSRKDRIGQWVCVW